VREVRRKSGRELEREKAGEQGERVRERERIHYGCVQKVV